MPDADSSTRLWEVERTYVYSSPSDGQVTMLLPPTVKAPEAMLVSGLTYLLDSEATFKLRAWIRNKSEWAARQKVAQPH